jgi:hypothetical protein
MVLVNEIQDYDEEHERLNLWVFAFKYRKWFPLALLKSDDCNDQWKFGYAADQNSVALAGACARSAAQFLAVLNCVNVNTELIMPPAKLNKRKLKRGKLPIYEYHILVLKRRVKAAVPLGGTSESPRVHLRRGHIKRRKTGSFWWQPCVVGDPKRGVVEKAYRADDLMKCPGSPFATAIQSINPSRLFQDEAE